MIGTLAQEERERRGPKFFGVTLQVHESDPRLRPGMTAQVEIQVEERVRALYVPLEAVFVRDGRNLVYVAGLRGPREVEVTLGPSNHDFVVIEKGLAKGARVYLRDPLGSVAEPGQSQQ
jgi:multidrug efflux pump subunit AcrA (membrane-fusion protein)